MKIAAWTFALAAILVPQSDEEKAVVALKAYLKAIQESDFEKAADFIHPRSRAKIRDRIVSGSEKAPEATRATLARKLGFENWDALVKADARALFTALLKNLRELGEGGAQLAGAVESATATVLGTVKKDGRVYIVAETTYELGKETHVVPVLHVAYKDGDAWKLAHRNETNIGK